MNLIAQVANDVIPLGTDTTGNYVSEMIAQVTNSVPAVGSGISPGMFGTPQFYVDALTPFIGPLLTAFVKSVAPKIPSGYIPAIAVALGVATNALGTVVINGDVSWWKAVLLGLAGIGIRELKDRIKPAESPTTTP